MAVIDLGAKRREARLQQMMMLSEMINKGPLGTGESALDKELARQEAERLNREEEGRRKKESEARVGIAESEHRRKMAEFEEVQQLREEQFGLTKREAEERIARSKEMGERGEKRLGFEERKTELAERLGESQIETEEEKRAGEVAKTGAAQEWARQQQADSMEKMAKGIWAEAIRNYAMGNTQMFTKENTDHIEKAGTLLFGPGYTVPRDEQGRWKPDPKTVALGMPNEKGEYTGEFGKALAEINKPGTPFESWLKAANEAEAAGDTESQRLLLDRAQKDIRPNMSEAQGEVFNNFVKRNDLAGAKQFITDISASKAKTRASAVSAVKVHSELNSQQNLYASLGNLLEQYDAIVRPSEKYPRGRIPVGSMHKPFYDVFGKVERMDPDIAVFYGNANMMMSRYINEITGKQSNPQEREDLKKAFVNPDFDTVKTFRHRVIDMMRNTQRTMRQSMGYYNAIGIQLPNLGPGFEPISPAETMERWGKGVVVTPDGLVDRQEFVDAERGTKAIGDQVRRSGERIGGEGEFRAKGGDVSYKYDPSSGAYMRSPEGSPFEGLSDEELRAELKRLEGGSIEPSMSTAP